MRVSMPPEASLVVEHAQRALELRDGADHVEQRARLGARVEPQAVDRQDLDQILGQQRLVGLGVDLIAGAIELGLAERRMERSGAALDVPPVRNRSA